MTETMVRGSYERVDYAVRPAKSIERKMMLEVLRGLSEFGALRDYQYVGFGATQFVDFILAHRELGIEHLISIEKDVHNKVRFEFNKPFRSVIVEYGRSVEVLPGLDWDRRAIVWLDYDSPLDLDVISDVRTVAGVARSGSVLIVTVDVEHDPDVRDSAEWLRRRLGDYVPIDVTNESLVEWGLAVVCRRIINSAIRNALSDRSRGGNQYSYSQLFNYEYRDGARMTSVGGLISDAGDSGHLAAADFGAISHVRQTDAAYRINVPKLTVRERLHLDRQLPCDPDQLVSDGIPPEDLAMYAEVYRYFPNFRETT